MSEIRAIGFNKSLPIDDQNSLKLFKIKQPSPTGHDLLIKVNAISVNPVDIFQRRDSNYDSKTPKILGFDGVGIVEDIGEQVTLFQPGDRVYYAGDLTRSGSYRQFELIDEWIVGQAPQTLSDAQAAALPLTSLTAWEGLFEILGIDPNNREQNQRKTILLINGAGGAGSMVTQLAHWAGLTVIASASRAETSNWVKRLGADQVVNHHNNLVNEVRQLEYQYVDYIFDMHSVDRHWQEMTELIASGGRIVSITRDNQPLNLTDLKNKRASFGWEFMFSKAMLQTNDLISQHDILNKIAELVNQNSIVSTMTESLSPINVSNLKKAHQQIESGKMIGKVVLSNWAENEGEK